MSHNEIARPDAAESGPLPYGLVRLGFSQPPATVPPHFIFADDLVKRVREQHTDAHDDWDQGGYCNALVQDENGDGDICGYRKPLDASEISVRLDTRVPVGASCVLTTGNDMEAHATWFNEGYEAAVAQGLADDPTLAEDWLNEQRKKAMEAAVAALHLEESQHRFDPIGGLDTTVCALCGLDPEAAPHQHFEILYKAIHGVRAVTPGDQPDVMHDEKMLEGYQLALADVNAVLDHYFGPVKS